MWTGRWRYSYLSFGSVVILKIQRCVRFSLLLPSFQIPPSRIFFPHGVSPATHSLTFFGCEFCGYYVHIEHAYVCPQVLSVYFIACPQFKNILKPPPPAHPNLLCAFPPPLALACPSIPEAVPPGPSRRHTESLLPSGAASHPAVR